MNSSHRRLLGGVLVVFGIFLLTFSFSHLILAAVNGGDPTQCEDKGDNDNDGVKNCVDYCPEQSQGSNVDPSHRGCPIGVFDSNGCNNNGMCEVNLGETVQNCRDCQTVGTPGSCPFKGATLQYFGTCPDFPQLNGLPTSATSYRFTATTTAPSCQYDTCTYSLYYNADVTRICPGFATTTQLSFHHSDLPSLCGDLHYIGGQPPIDPTTCTTTVSLTHVPYNIDNPQAPLACQSPNVNLTKPVGGAVLAIPTTTSATVAGIAEAIQKVQFLIVQNDTTGITAAVSNPPYQSTFTPPTTNPGFYSLMARAVTTSGQTYDSHQVPIFVDPAPAPPPPPPPPPPAPLKIVAPDPQIANYAWAALRGAVNFQAVAQSPVGMQSAVFSLDGGASSGMENSNGQKCSPYITEIPYDQIERKLFWDGFIVANPKVTDVTENPLAQHLDSQGQAVFTGGLGEWSMWDEPDIWPGMPPLLGGSGDWSNITKTMEKMQSYCGYATRPYKSGVDLFNYLDQFYFNSDYPVDFPIPFALTVPGGVGGHELILLSVDDVSSTLKNLHVLDSQVPGKESLVQCLANPTPIDTTDYWRCKATSYNWPALNPQLVWENSIEAERVKTGLMDYCDPSNITHWTSDFCKVITSGDRKALIKRVVNNPPFFQNYGVPSSPGGICAGYSTLVLRAAYLANYIGEACHAGASPQTFVANINTANLSDGPHTLVVKVTDNNNKTQTASQTFLVNNNGPITYAPQCADGIDNDGNGRFDYLRTNQSNINTYDSANCSGPDDNTESFHNPYKEKNGEPSTKAGMLGVLNFTPTWQPITSFFESLIK